MDALPSVGDIVAEKYRVEGLIGEGSMGRVYRAHHLLLGQDVAIKLLRASVDTNELRTRFIREAKATMALRGEHTVRVYDLGVLPDNTPYMVLEFLEGTDLRSILASGGALPVDVSVDYVLQACEALAEAHLAGIVHRDLKPQNLFLTHRPNGTSCVKLLDFGVSKFDTTLDGSGELTMSHVLLGSPVFMSPEQVRDSRKVDSRADLWSIGVVLYMLVGGGRPFEGEGLGGTCASIMVDPPRPLVGRCPNVTPELEAIIFKCLEKHRDRRTQDVAELAKSLEPFASPHGRASVTRIVQRYAAAPPSARTAARAVATAPVPPAARLTEATATDVTSIDNDVPVHEASVAGAVMPPQLAPPRRGRALLGLALAAGVLAAGGAGYWRLRSLRSQAPAAVVAAAAPSVTTAPGAPSPPAPVDTAAKPDDAPVENGVAAALPMPIAPAPASSRRGIESGARGAKASGGTGAKRKGQLDRNGVPIID